MRKVSESGEQFGGGAKLDPCGAADCTLEDEFLQQGQAAAGREVPVSSPRWRRGVDEGQVLAVSCLLVAGGAGDAGHGTRLAAKSTRVVDRARQYVVLR